MHTEGCHTGGEGEGPWATLAVVKPTCDLGSDPGPTFLAQVQGWHLRWGD